MTVIYLQYINCRVARIHKTTHNVVALKSFDEEYKEWYCSFGMFYVDLPSEIPRMLLSRPIQEWDKNLPCPLHPKKKAMQTHTPSMVSVHLSAWQPELGFSGLDRGSRLHDCVRGRTPGEGGERSSAGHGSRRRERITPPGGQGRSREWS